MLAQPVLRRVNAVLRTEIISHSNDITRTECGGKV